MSRYSRRDFLKKSSLVVGSLPFLGVDPISSILRINRAQAQTVPGRFIHIFLQGGWDSAFATDPVVGTKGANYDSAYSAYTPAAVTGKSNLVVGEGLLAARTSMENINTCFINGMQVEVTAHDLAARYLLSGSLSLSRSREFPSIGARLGKTSSSFPPHVVLGAPVPLGDTVATTPPLQSADMDALHDILAGAALSIPNISQGSINTAESLVASLNTLNGSSYSTNKLSGILGWQNSERSVSSIYSAQHYQDVELTSAINTRYGITSTSSIEALLAVAFLTLSSGMSPYVTVNVFVDLDTHSNHIARHLPTMSTFTTAFNTFISDLRTTADPTNGGSMLSDTTLILVSSEFVRTPMFNAASGTDHWPSGSAFLMGPGVSDNTVVGATDDEAMPLGWSGGSSTTLTEDTRILPDHLTAAILHRLGFTSEAADVSTKRLDEVFS